MNSEKEFTLPSKERIPLSKEILPLSKEKKQIIEDVLSNIVQTTRGESVFNFVKFQRGFIAFTSLSREGRLFTLENFLGEWLSTVPNIEEALALHSRFVTLKKSLSILNNESIPEEWYASLFEKRILSSESVFSSLAEILHSCVSGEGDTSLLKRVLSIVTPQFYKRVEEEFCLTLKNHLSAECKNNYFEKSIPIFERVSLLSPSLFTLESVIPIFNQKLESELEEIHKFVNSLFSIQKVEKYFKLISLSERATQFLSEEIRIKILSELEEDTLFSVYKNYSPILSHSNDECRRAFTSAFTFFLKKNVASIPSLIDDINGRISEDREERISLLTFLISAVEDKDYVLELIHSSLIERMLKKTNIALEEEIVSVIKNYFRGGVHSLEGVIRDFYTKRDIPKNLGIDFDCLLITPVYWNLHPEKVILPPEIERAQLLFEELYRSKNKNRVLGWNYQKARATLIFTPSEGSSEGTQSKYEITCSGHQAIILLLFNDSYALTPKEISEKSNIPIKDVLASLLTMLKCRILKSEDAKIRETTPITLGVFSHPKRRVHLPPPKKLIEPISEFCLERRKFVYDTNIIKVMKSRKRIDFTTLFGELGGVITLFRPDPKEIKIRLEDLIQREFISRDSENSNVFEYIS